MSWASLLSDLKAFAFTNMELCGYMNLAFVTWGATSNSFIEKIFLHTHQLDDKLVEYVKYQLYGNPVQRIDPVRSELLYDFSTCDGEKLAFVVVDRESGRAIAGAHIPMAVYEELAAAFLNDGTFQDELDSLFPGYYVSVDRLI